MDALFLASYVAKQRRTESRIAATDAFYAQYERRNWTLAPLASALGLVAAWAGLLSLVPTA